ncbi:hypothetical protein QS468_34295 [Bacillus subtilis]|jgi:hypothetical protein|nr:hypothetical protein [Pseudomonas sp. A29(2023)]MDL5597818.1 hypothetical protein [Bacillus subtilis]
MPTTYRIVNEPFELFYSDTNLPGSPIMGINCRDPNNVAYQLYNKPYGTYQRLGGCNLKLPSTIPYSPGMIADVYADNATTGLPANSFAHQQTLTSNTPGKIYIGVPSMTTLGAGLIDCYGSVTDNASNIIYIVKSFYFTIQLP